MKPIEITVWICAAVFAVTATITLLALIGKVRLGRTTIAHDTYLKQLFRILICEVVVISVGGFSHYTLKTNSDDVLSVPMASQVAHERINYALNQMYNVAYAEMDTLLHETFYLRKVGNEILIGDSRTKIYEFNPASMDIENPSDFQIEEAKTAFYREFGDTLLSNWDAYKADHLRIMFRGVLFRAQSEFESDIRWSLTSEPRVEGGVPLNAIINGAGAAWRAQNGSRYEQLWRKDYEATIDYEFAKFCSRSLSSAQNYGVLSSFVRNRTIRPKPDIKGAVLGFDSQAKEAVAQAITYLSEKPAKGAASAPVGDNASTPKKAGQP